MTTDKWTQPLPSRKLQSKGTQRKGKKKKKYNLMSYKLSQKCEKGAIGIPWGVREDTTKLLTLELR